MRSLLLVRFNLEPELYPGVPDMSEQKHRCDANLSDEKYVIDYDAERGVTLDFAPLRNG
ncbi:MAG TPA: hypothetical protein VIG05_07770 [Candidatus Nitrosotenuis sp.]|jgi:hypothetical protein